MNHTELLSLLDKISGSGHFVHQGARPAGLYGITVNGFGEVPLPLIPIVAKGLLEVAKPAPFGLGEKTVYDKTVRSTYEIDATQISFVGHAWNELLQEIVTEVKVGLGLDKVQVEAHLYKMLIYQPGDFFLPHRDSEKEKGMFGTLVIGLPSTHTGGELWVQAAGQRAVADFSGAAPGTLPFVAFFADCEHEIKPILTGYRVCLTYNLVKKGRALQFNNPAQHVSALTHWLAAYQKAAPDTTWPKVLMFEHQYTPANFTLDNLKGVDRPRAEALIQACEEAGLYAAPCLLTYHEHGSWEPEYAGRGRGRGRGRSWYDDYDLDEDNPSGGMGEVYDSSISIAHWDEASIPGLGEIDIELDEQVWSKVSYKDADPIEKQAEGPTGNAGMELQYWYHYGAVCIWPKASLYQVLPSDPEVCLRWLDFFAQKVERGNKAAAADMQRLLLDYDYSGEDALSSADPIIRALILADNKKLATSMMPVLSEHFYAVGAEAFAQFGDVYGASAAKKVITPALETDKHRVVVRALLVLHHLATQTDGVETAIEIIKKLPKTLSKNLFKAKQDDYDWMASYKAQYENQVALVSALIALSRVPGVGSSFVEKTTKMIEASLGRKFIFSTLAPALLLAQNKGAQLHTTLLQLCMSWLTKKTKKAPKPLPDWTRPYPKEWDDETHACHHLVAFMQSPTLTQYRFVRAERQRQELQSAVRALDITPSTIKSGSPYTLLLTKNQAAFEAKMKQHKEELNLLDQLKPLA